MGSEKYITLKEAAEISGYAPDYIGQLIRNGKVSGKQVYSNIAWVTTEEAINEYMKNSKTAKKKQTSDGSDFVSFILSDPSKIYKIFLYFSICVLVFFSIVLFYILAVGIDQNIEKRLLEKVEIRDG